MLREYPGCHFVPFGDVGAIRAIHGAPEDEFHQRDIVGLSRRPRTPELARLFDTLVSWRANGEMADP
jgi:hypothetical protein